MEDSTAMTIEYLRARLLSERSVSRTARQRADELAKRVMELEKQLKVVSLQRKKAEKAAADVLAILENQGRSDVSETFDSSSDPEAMLFDSKVGSYSLKEEKTSGNLKVGENGMEAFSGSELESSSQNGRSLSWKSSKESLRSFDKTYMDASRRRRNSFASTGSSSPKRVGKSCRQIRRKEHRSAVEELQNDATTIVNHEDVVATNSDGIHHCSDIVPETSREASENDEKKNLLEVPVSVILENHSASNGHSLNNCEGDKDMERALEHQAQLIGRYEAEEKAQREWEDKFRENNGSTPDSCDPGNHSDVTEEREEIKALALPSSTGVITSPNQEEKTGARDACCSEESKTPTSFQPSPQFEKGSLENQDNGTTSSKFPPSEFAFSAAEGKHDEDYSVTQHHNLPLHGAQNSTDLRVSTSENNSVHVSSGSSLYKGETSGSKNEFALMPHESSNNLGSVLEALQQAKLSLKQNFSGLLLSEGASIRRAIEPSFSTVRSGDRFAMPVGSAGLFRLPTDYQYGAMARANLVGSENSRLSIASYSRDPVGANLLSSPYMESRSATFMDDRFLTAPTFRYPDFGSGLPPQPSVFQPRFDAGLSNRYNNLDRQMSAGVPSSSFDAGLPYSGNRYNNLDRQMSADVPSSNFDAVLPTSGNRYMNLDPQSSAGLPSSSRYTHTTYPSYPELMPRTPSDGRLPRFLPGRDAEVLPSAHFSFYDDHTTKPNMYR